MARKENKIRKTIIISPDLIILLVLSFPYTSVTISLMVNMKGIKNMATLALNFPKSGNVLAPINSETMMQNI
jgi:hypothetical protein